MLSVNTQPLGVSHSDNVSWYAAYTLARHEKRVAQNLAERELNCFLPVYRSLRRWKDRRKELELALFPSYVFVRIEQKNWLEVLKVPSVVNLVSCSGQPVPIPDDEINVLQRGLGSNIHVEPHPYLTAGRRARVKNGPLTGAEGIVVRRKNNVRLVLSVELLMRSLAVELDEVDLEPLI
jgi:transcription antitermination factor NusG